ncbi:type IV secretory pathway TrbL component [Rhizomicrobium palustre]|uniref:Type IV secretory pathway TrbL component n=1 Tax=Rhizomicrobium palustre TaxID=189966 RepID=A0A846N0Q9_9PROT|nr:YMGG-like glycine zipper-containing protein [Rhizomicrobium palustre]NIK89079.1 type IV secretory pathway TrbL component [Rhizomicrobium palustre]
MKFQALACSAGLISLLVLGGCGTSTGDRTVSGAALGAGAGALIGSTVGAPGTGAAIGAVGGAAIGATTDPCDLDLGTPYWRDHGGREEYDRRCYRRERHDRD